jgi:hypothetical protein
MATAMMLLHAVWISIHCWCTLAETRIGRLVYSNSPPGSTVVIRILRFFVALYLLPSHRYRTKQNRSCQLLLNVRMQYGCFTPGIPNLFWMATDFTKPLRFRDTPLTVRPPPPPSTQLEKKIHNYIIKRNKTNLTARFSYLIMSKAEFRLMTSDFKI